MKCRVVVIVSLFEVLYDLKGRFLMSSGVVRLWCMVFVSMSILFIVMGIVLL